MRTTIGPSKSSYDQGCRDGSLGEEPTLQEEDGVETARTQPVMAVHAYNASMREAKIGRSLSLAGHLI